jgi:hypothetical protein
LSGYYELFAGIDKEFKYLEKMGKITKVIVVGLSRSRIATRVRLMI